MGVAPAPRPATPDSASTMTDTASRPTTQPPRKAGPLALARAEKSIRMTAMMGTGLIATATANGRICPTTEPISSSLPGARRAPRARYLTRPDLPSESRTRSPRRHVLGRGPPDLQLSRARSREAPGG